MPAILNSVNEAEHLASDMQRIESLVESMQLGLHSAHTLRAGMRKHLNHYIPVNKLPVELLRTIGSPSLEGCKSGTCSELKNESNERLS